MIEKNIKDGIKIYQKRPCTDKNKRIINNSKKIINAIELFKSMIDNNEFAIPGEFNAKPNNNIDLNWMIDKDGYEEIAEEADAYYMKGKNDNESKLIKDFITKTNNGTINNKNKARNEFRKLKQKVTNDILRQDLIKYLEKYFFREDIESEEKYEESIAERVKTRRDTQRTFGPSIPLKEDYSAETDEQLKYLEEREKDLQKSSDVYDSSGSGLNKKGKGLKILTNKQMFNRLPILLAQIQAGNNSDKLKNETRQMLYSLYNIYTCIALRSKELDFVVMSTTFIKMETFFMNTKNSKTNESHRFKYDLIDKFDLKNPNRNMALGSLNIYYTWKKVKLTYNNKKFKISAPTWNETFDLPDGSYNISEIQDYIEYIIKKHEAIGENAPILIYANTINNRIVFKIKTETMKLLGSTKDIIDSDKNSENVPRLENVEVVLVHCNLVNNSYQQHSGVLFTFVPNKQYGQLINISPRSLIFLKTMNTEFSEIDTWFTDQNNNALEIEDNVNISLIINAS